MCEFRYAITPCLMDRRYIDDLQTIGKGQIFLITIAINLVYVG